MGKNRRKHILNHLIFWTIYLVLWGARDMIFYPDIISNISVNVIFTLSVIPFIYINLYFLIPRFLLKRKWGIYSLFFGLGFLLILWSRYQICQFIFRDVIGAIEAADRFYSWDGYVIIASENLVLIMITMALYLIQEYYEKERYAHKLEQKNTESELSLLKAQLQPHFLFNNLNTIYFLMETNPTLAKEVIIQFSDILSHQLYNAQKDAVPLKEELESLENYLKIQQIRHEDFLDLQYSFPKHTNNLQIAPMILLTFLENAFKHGQREQGYFISIDIQLEGNAFYLHLENSNGGEKSKEKGGIGLENVQKRLSLIYPKKHDLQIEKTDESYTVNLSLTLEPSEKA